MSSALWVFVFLLIATAIGYGVGRWQIPDKRGARKKDTAAVWPQSHYYKGLTHLLKDEPDAAIDTFISTLEINDDTLEIHLALGGLLRRRGELARAVKVHQNLLARSDLSTAQSHMIQLELASDFLRSGLLDRAENLLKDLVDRRDIKKHTRAKALERLLQVYQDMGDWLEAIDTADQLTAKKFESGPDRWRVLQSHFSCELARHAINKHDWSTARRYVRNAQNYDEHNARANLLHAEISIANSVYSEAIDALLRVPQQSAQYISEILDPLVLCYSKMQSHEECLDVMAKLYDEHRGHSLLVFLIQLFAREGDYERLGCLLHTELSQYPDLSVIAKLYALANPSQKDAAAALVGGYLSSLQYYLCSRCGFEGKQLHWMCPGCQHWASISITP